MLEFAIVLTIGLDIPYDVSMKLIKTANFNVVSNTEEGMLYNFFLFDACTMTVDECSDILEARGFKPLNRETKETVTS